MQYGDVKRSGEARLKPAGGSDWGWKPSRKDHANRAAPKRDKYPKIQVSRFAPELVEAARALKIHPAELEKQLKLARKMAQLQSSLKG